MNDNAWQELKARLVVKGVDLPKRFGERLQLWQMLEQAISCGGSNLDDAIEDVWRRYCAGERPSREPKEGGCTSCAEADSCGIAGGATP